MRKTLLLIPAVAVAIAIAGCGSNAAAPAPVASKHAIVKTRHGSLGTFLVDGKGRTLYRFLKDKSRKSTCSGSCAIAWPPLTTREKPEAEGGAKASKLSTSRRANGARQVVYAGHPLYRYAPDPRPGQTNGQGVNAYGGRWYVVAPSGKAIRSSAAPAPTPVPYPY
jgi:predicted lipoprotein with Yx(FWY)xxD motif